MQLDLSRVAQTGRRVEKNETMTKPLSNNSSASISPRLE